MNFVVQLRVRAYSHPKRFTRLFLSVRKNPEICLPPFFSIGEESLIHDEFIWRWWLRVFNMKQKNRQKICLTLEQQMWLFFQIVKFVERPTIMTKLHDDDSIGNMLWNFRSKQNIISKNALTQEGILFFYHTT